MAMTLATGPPSLPPFSSPQNVVENSMFTNAFVAGQVRKKKIGGIFFFSAQSLSSTNATQQKKKLFLPLKPGVIPTARRTKPLAHQFVTLRGNMCRIQPTPQNFDNPTLTVDHQGPSIKIDSPFP